MNRYQEWELLKADFEREQIPFSEIIQRASVLFFLNRDHNFLMKLLNEIQDLTVLNFQVIRNWKNGESIPNKAIQKMVVNAISDEANECLNKDAYFVAGQLRAVETILGSLGFQNDDLVLREGGRELLNKIRDLHAEVLTETSKLRQR